MDYIKLSRKILEWEWYSDINTKVLFLHMLLKANWKKGRFQGVEIPRGSFASSLNNLSEETGLSIQNVRTCIKRLKTTGEITVIQHSKFSVFTIINYCAYQDTNTDSNNYVTQSQQGINTDLTTIEEGKKERRKEYNNSFSNEKLSTKNEENERIFVTIRELYNSVCGSYPRLAKMSQSRKKAIHARLRTGYTIDDFSVLFKKAEASDFLKGKNNRNWSADFDWLIRDSNMAKVLEGKYDNKKEERHGAGGEVKKNEKGYLQRAIEQGFEPKFDGF